MTHPTFPDDLFDQADAMHEGEVRKRNQYQMNLALSIKLNERVMEEIPVCGECKGRGWIMYQNPLYKGDFNRRICDCQP